MTTPTFALPPGLAVRRPQNRPNAFVCNLPSSSPPTTRASFSDLALPPNLLRAVTALHAHPTPTQALALPALLAGKDVLLHAPTGTGKTLCYLLTILSRTTPSRASAQALVLVPTPELGAQVAHVLQKLTAVPFAVLLDGDQRAQRKALRTGPRVVVGTPARVWQMSRVLRLELVRVLVVDEFDSCLGDSEATRALVSILAVPAREGRQTVLCSATVPQQRHFLRRAVREGWLKKDVVHVRGEGGLVVPEGLVHAYVVCEGPKLDAVAAVVRRFRGQVVVFVSEGRDVDEVVDGLEGVGGGVAGIRREWSAGERRHVMSGFREGSVRTLVATDVAARGIDVPEVVAVVQMDLPRDAEGYLHRAGRAGRMGRRGWSVLVIAPGEGFVVDRFANVLGVEFRELRKKG